MDKEKNSMENINKCNAGTENTSKKNARKENISIEAKIVRQLINIATSDHLIGPKIKKGTFRRKMIEPPWKCPAGYSLLPVRMKKFNMEILTPPEVNSGCIVLQLHGGGYIGKMRNVYRSFAKYYSDMRGGMKVLTIDYRVAPENPYPAALYDALSAYNWLLGLGYKGRDIIVAGDSAGGGLALALAEYLRDNGIELPASLVLMSPWTDLTASGTSYETNYELDPLFGNTHESMIYNGEYVGDNDPATPYISPLFGDFKGLPPMLFQAGSIEMLLSDSVDAAEKAKEAGCDVILNVYNGMFHVFQMALELLPESKQAWQEVKEFVEKAEETELS